VNVTLSEQVNDMWTVLGTIKSGLDGSFVLAWDKATLGTHTLKVSARNRVNTVESATVTLYVVPFVTIAGPATGTVKTSVMLQGTLIPTTANVNVTIWRQIGTGKWKAIRTTKTNKSGRWGVLCGVGTVTASVRFVAKITDPVIGAAKSPSLTLTVS
jgi:5-hydroxyisourate hydrolase-like protein (transthyretin family)